MSLDILAIAAHRDDVEQTCGGTLLKMAQGGQGNAVPGLTQAEVRRLGRGRALEIPEGRVENTWENRLKVASVIRETRPRVVILPYWKGRHPDHYTCSVLGYEACFLAGLAKLVLSSQFSVLNDASSGGSKDGPLAPHRPFKIIYATLYYDVRPTFVVDIGPQFAQKFASTLAYKSQFSDQEAGKDLFPAHNEIRARVDAMARYYGVLGGVTYAEPFLQKEVGLVEDLLAIPVKSI